MKQGSRTIIESMGVYLPPKSVSTADVVQGCATKKRIPLESLTGIQSRRMAGEDEFAFDLAEKAVAECFATSKYGPADIDLLISSNISRYDGPRQFSFEPSTSMRLRSRFGLHHALALDITNACAGMFTGIYIVDALIRAGAIRRGLVVSGEYITHLTTTAQQEITGLTDPRIACLTLGDAGAAVILEATSNHEWGFHALELYTLGRYSSYCIAKVTNRPSGLAIMTTDMIRLATVSLKFFFQHSAYTVFRLGWPAEAIDHVLPHQTSRTTIKGGSREVKRLISSRTFKYQDKVINNITDRGNTASTSHFVALKDCILSGKVKSHQSVLFGILASGITVGTAVYRFDDLPDRIRQSEARAESAPRFEVVRTAGRFASRDQLPRIRVEALGTLGENRPADTDTVAMLAQAAEDCLENSSYARKEIDLLLSTGTYRTDFLSEPAVATLLAGALKINDTINNPLDKKSLAFDVINGGLGFLNACYLGTVLIRSGSVRLVMVAASEVENNAEVAPEELRGLRETASAVILDQSKDGETGFGAFLFKYFPEHLDSFWAYASCDPGRAGHKAYLVLKREPDLERRYVDCVASTVGELLESQGLAPADVKLVLPPQISPGFIAAFSEALGFEREKVVDITQAAKDLFTSSLPYCLQHVQTNHAVSPGDIGLLVNVASGIQIGCAIYHF